MEIERQVQQTFQQSATRFRTGNGEEMNRQPQILSERFQPNQVLSAQKSGSNDQKGQQTKSIDPQYNTQCRSQQIPTQTTQTFEIQQVSKYEQIQRYRREHPLSSSFTNEILIQDLGLLGEDSNPTAVVQLYYQINMNASCLLILKLNISRLSWGFTQTQDFCSSLTKCTNLLEFDVNLAMNGVSDSGSELIAFTLGNLQALEIISLNLEKNNLCKKGFCMLEAFNTLPCLLSFSLDIRGNHLAIEEEITKMLVKFQSNRIFRSIQRFKIAFDEIAPSQIQRNSENSNNNILLNPNQMEAMKQYLELKNQVDKTQFQIHNYSSEILQLRNYSQQLQMQGLTDHQHPQLQEVIFRINQSQNNLQMLLNLLAAQQQSLSSPQFQQFKEKDRISDQEMKNKKKKTVMCRLLEIMLKFTDSLQEFSLSCPGQLMNEVSWEYLGELLRNKATTLESFCLQILSCARLGPSPKEVGYVTYQLGKLLKLHTLKLELSNLSTPSCLFLSRFLSELTQLRNLSLKLPHLDVLSNQQETLQDLCNFIQSLQSPVLSSIEIDISKSIFDDNLALKLSTALVQKKQTIQQLTLNVKDCPNLTDQSLHAFKQMLLDQQRLSSLKLDVSQNRINSAILLSAMPALQYPLLNLNLNLLCPFQTPTNSLSKTLSDSILQIHTLTTCAITLSRDSSVCSRILIERALQTKRLLKMIQLFKATSPLVRIARKEFSFQILQHLLP